MARILEAFKQFFDGNGDPLASGSLKFTVSGTNATDKDTFADTDETIPNTNPVILDAEGRVPNVFGTGSYRVTLLDSEGVQISQKDPVPGTGIFSQWGDWEATVSYSEGQIVASGSVIFRSLSNNNENNEPSISPIYWESVILTTVYNSSAVYAANSIIVYESSLYLASEETDEGPDTNPDAWVPLKGFPVYSVLVNYAIGVQVQGSTGLIYTSLIANGPATTVVNPVDDVTGTWEEFLKNPIAYKALSNYAIGATTQGSDGNRYRCAIANGPATTVVDPVGDATGTWLHDNFNVIGTSIASDTTIVIPNNGNYFLVTGSTNIEEIISVRVGASIRLQMPVGPITFVHSANLILPSALDIITQGFDIIEFTEYSANVWLCTNYFKNITPGDIQPGDFVFLPYEPTTGQMMNRGLLEGNGGSVLDADYPEILVAWGGKIYGNVDATHFNLPFLSGQLPRFWDHGAGIDPGATVSITGDTTSGAATIINVSSMANVEVGMLITGTGIPASSTILSIDSTTQVTISNNATATASSVALTLTNRTDRGDGTTGDAVGTFQDSQNKKHDHFIEAGSFGSGGGTGNFVYLPVDHGGTSRTPQSGINIYTGYQGSAETRPKNINIWGGIKYNG
jgi:hypothetical protein